MKKRRIFALVLSVLILVSGMGPEYASGILETVAKAEGTGNEECEYTYTVDSGFATITGYIGSDTEIVTPATLGGYPVTCIGDYAFKGKNIISLVISEGVVRAGVSAFSNCSSMAEIRLPSTLQTISYGGFDYDTSLENINVADGNPYFFSMDGVLFKYVSEGVTLYTYPADKEGTAYKIPNFVDSVMGWAFSDSKNIEKIYIPYTVGKLYDRIFCEMNKSIDVYLNHSIIPSYSAEMFYNMPSGCHVLVKNQSIADAINTNIFYNTPDSSIIVMDTDENYPSIPTESLTWDGTNAKTSLLLHEGESYYLGGEYEQLPENSTDNITWKSSNTTIATVDSKTGKIQASGCENFPLKVGDCEITGTDESGHSITISLTVYQAITDTELYCGSINPTSYTVSYNGENKTKWISYITTPNRAYNWANTVWETSNPAVATVQKDETDKEYALLTFLSPGTTTITATINDNGTIFTRSFKLTVTKNISDCTLSASDQTYTGKPISPKIVVKDGSKVLTEGTDYTLSYKTSDNINAGTATVTVAGKEENGYTGSKTISFKIQKAVIDISKVTWTNTALTYTKKNQAVTLKNVPSGVTVNYSGNKKTVAGKYTATAILSSANYTFTTDAKFSTVWYIRSNQSISLSSKNVKNDTITVPYGTASFRLGGKAKTTISYSGGSSKVATVDKKGKLTVKGTGYTTITVTAKQTDSYKKVTKTIQVYVTPKKESITYLKSRKQTQFTMKWKKDSRASGYQIQYSTGSKFSSKQTKSITVSKNSTVSGTIKNLNKGKRYYVRVRAYKTVKVDGKSVKKYGSWSSVKKL